MRFYLRHMQCAVINVPDVLFLQSLSSLGESTPIDSMYIYMHQRFCLANWNEHDSSMQTQCKRALWTFSMWVILVYIHLYLL